MQNLLYSERSVSPAMKVKIYNYTDIGKYLCVSQIFFR